jgi:uncharacterized RDD family membrane protein YckC/Tfp pilus assembly major pilin PilA
MYCMQCGTLNADSAATCTKCGKSLTGAAAAAPGPSVYAGFWIRVGATLIDQFILSAAYFVLVFVGVFAFAGFTGLADSPDPMQALGFVLLVWGVLLAGPWLYAALMESSARQGTVGKLACGIKVTDLNGERISFGRATGRHFAEWITGFTFLIGYIMAGFTQKRQTLHDMIASTLVVRSNASAPEVQGSAPAPSMSGWAIAAICLAGSFFPLGILAAIAIPAYQDYTIRTQVQEGLVIASDFKAAVAEHQAMYGDWIPDAEAAELADVAKSAAHASRYVSSIEIANGTITITYGKSAHHQIARRRLSLQPYVDENGEVVWQCGNAGPPDYVYSNAGGAEGGGAESAPGRTTVLDRHVPPKCRSGFDDRSMP